MRRVFTNAADVIHLWAQRTQDEARSSNVYFDDRDSIYSYGRHYLLAKFIDDRAVWINDDGYSVTTAKHIGLVTGATNQYTQFFKSTSDAERVLEYLRHNAKKLRTARKPELYISAAVRTWTKYHEYLTYTRTLTKAKKTVGYKEAAAIMHGIENDPKNVSDVIAKNARLREARERREAERKQAAELERFRTYKSDFVYQRNGRDFLRVREDGQGIETSQRIRLTWDEAKRLLRLLDLGKILGARVNDAYTITGANGSIVAGCHNIERDEVERIRHEIEAA